MGHTKDSDRAAALALVKQVERQASDIVRSFADGKGLSGGYAAFRDFTEKLGQFHVFVTLVEGRLGDIEPAKQAAQAKNLTDIRWRLMLLEIAAMQSFMQRFLASGRPWPMGSKAFLVRRQDRLDEITAFHRDSPADYALTPPDAALVHSVKEQFAAQQGQSLALDDFGSAAARADPVSEPASRREAPRPAESAPPLPPVRTLPPAAPGSGLKPKKRLGIRADGDNVYLDADGAAVVNDACKVAQIGLDELASQMGLSRSTLVLLLSGRDAIERKPLTQLRAFVMKNGGLI
jgi:hypothetical protein